MVNLSKFAETLCELMFENNDMTAKSLAEQTGLPAPAIIRYRKAQHAPNVNALLKLAEYFNCSCDFLLGLEEYNGNLTFKKCPPFSEQIEFLVKYSGLSYYGFYNSAEIPESSFFEWKNGSALPNIYSLNKIAEFLERRIDFVLGRES